MTFKTFCCRHLWPVIQCGTYDGGNMDPNYVFVLEEEPDFYWENDREFIAVNDMDFNGYKKAMAKEILKIFQDEKPLEKFGVKVIGADIDSPREYNFRTDWAELTIEVPDTFVEATMEWVEKSATRTKIAKKWIQDYWTSYDGWWSCMPESWTELHQWIERKDPREMEVLAGGLLGILTKIDQPDLLEDDHVGELPFSNLLDEAMREHYSSSDFYPVYKPNELLRKYGLDTELRIDEKEDDLSKIREKMGDMVEYRLDELAYADLYGNDEAKERAKKYLIEALKKANIEKLMKNDKDNKENN